jgi:predicted N-acetyltransferase YhbS
VRASPRELTEAVEIEDRTYRRPDFPRHLEQQALDFIRIVWSDGFMDEDRFRERMHEVPDDTTHFVRVAGSLLVSHVQVIPITVDGRDRPVLLGGVSGVLTYPQFRGEGHGSAVLRKAAEHIGTTGIDLGMLFCDPDTAPFYEALGWRALARGRVVVLEDPDSDDLIMVLGDDALLPDVLQLEWSW